MSEPLVVIGIGDDGPTGLAPQARAHIVQAVILAGGRRHLEFFPEFPGDKILIDAERERWLALLRSHYRQRKTVVLASGDPLFYGVGRLLLDFFPRDEIEFLPHLSSVQLAFARIKEAWHNARTVSLHGRPMRDLLPALAARAAKIAVLTDTDNHPGAIARLLREQGQANDYHLWVCENLGSPRERITQWSPAVLRDETFSPLNVVVLVRTHTEEPNTSSDNADAAPVLGIPESMLRHQGEPDGMITKREVRMLTLCYLELHPGDVLWDVGAGSGSVGLEAARVSPQVRVYAVERSAEAIEHMEQNCQNLGATAVRIVHGEAPEALAQLPEPDAVFIGGNGGRLDALLSTVIARLRSGGRLVLNCITLENLARSWELLQTAGLNPEVTSVQLAHSRPLGRWHCFEPEKPLFLVRGRKP